ncbi:CHAT domain-containing protein [Saccharothrix variisporea]|uniref:CHAT domain-containing protein n=1 Tax=Saccharothrix variisporea TaxID=543527 RepID=A0A495X121_9PSEU|nr:CHAT domain-containing protein [Saccharothrix variisporea]RKT66914.1 CHAT domain-containing protein [Saccharothrix variisporea]
MTDFTLRGRPVVDQADDDFAELYGDDVGYAVRGEVQVAGTGRGDTESVTLSGEDDDVVEVEDTDGVVHFYRAATLVSRAEAGRRGDVTAFLDERTRDGGSRLAAVRRVKTKLPEDVRLAVRELDAATGPVLSRSGVLDSAQGVIAGRVAEVALDAAAKAAVRKLVDFIDAPTRADAPEDVWRRKPKPRGVYSVGVDLHLAPGDLLTAPPASGSDPYLVLVHGTFSHTEAAFGKLRGTPEWARIVERYQGRVLALEHATLGLTPAQNALLAVPHLPDAPLHLVTHSRGGLVGEVLSYAATHEPVLAAYEGVDHPDVDALPRLRRALEGRQVRVQRFARVACPAMGTTLASGRIDKWASFLFNVFHLVPVLRETGIAALIKKFLLTVLEQRIDPRVMPGMEAQMPESPFLRTLLAAPPLDDGLGAIAGDAQGRGLLSKLLVRGADLFYGEDHDLVVPTSSMSGGAARVRSRCTSFQGARVNHGSYFANEDSRQALETWLAGDDAAAFETPPPPHWPVRRGEDRVSGEVLVVPDLLGSTLVHGGTPLWPDPARLVAHGPGKVLGGRDGEPGGLVPNYALLTSALASRYAVAEWPFDPRRDLDDLAGELAVRLDTGSPVHVVAHGAGALVLLAALRSVGDRWHAAGGRAVLLGPPLQGSWLVRARLAGKDEFTAAVALLDHRADAATVGSWFETWPLLRALDPDAADARAALTPGSWTGITAVYGSAERTVCGSRDDVFRVSADGDGFTCRPGGAAPGPVTWYALVPHADLPADPDTAAAVLDLLAGRTPGRLLRSPTARSGVDGELADARGLLVLPTADHLVRTAWGGGRRSTARRKALRVGVVHGDLRWAGGAVLVGHQDGTPISGAEQALDACLGGALERRVAFRQYPGRLGTCEVFGAVDGPCGVVIGLGDAGDLTPGALIAGVTGGALKLAARHEDRAPRGATEVPVSVSAVLIGTALVPPMPVDNAVTAIIAGVRQANRRLEDLRSPVRFDELKIVELYEERAIQATKAAVRLAQTLDSDSGEVVVERRLLDGVDGKPGAPAPYREGVWRTVRIVAEGSDRGDRLGALSFTSIGRSARAEQRVNSAQRKLLDALVAEAIADHQPDEQLYNTLYELLVPNALKGQGYGSENLLLVVDEQAGSLPLEMLASRTHDQDVEPLAVEVGVIRRLETRSFAEATRPSSGHAALVIGDPAGTGLPRLPAAREEARRVEKLLKSRGYDVTAIIARDDDREDVVPILNALFRQEYRIVHIAGHGRYDPTDPSRSGVVIGPDIHLGALEIAKMRTTPDVVFLNCCHLGAMRRQPADEQRADLLASSISRQLVENGVRAVVAAGWAVDDEAAHEFATTFYSGLLSGSDLGAAALTARRVVHDRHRATNTWGAYQVYGPPAFRLDPAGDGVHHREELVARREFRDALADLRHRAGDAPDTVVGAIAAELRELVADVPAEWLGGGENAAIGDVWASLALYEQAVACYEAAQLDWADSGSVRSVEQLVNVRAKWAVELTRTPNPELPSPDALLGDAEKSAGLLLKMRETPERWALLGGVARRRAQCVARGKRKALTNALVEAREHYRKAVALHRERYGTVYYYPALNVVVLGWLAHQRDPEQPFDRAEAEKLVEESRQAAESVRRPDFWSRVTPADADFAQALVDGALDVDRIAAAYSAAFAQSSRRDRASVLDHVELVAHALPTSTDALGAAVSDLRTKLAEWTPE